MMTLKYPDGIDCVWIASDQHGHLGAFVTAGIGPIPISILSDETISIDEVESAICDLPLISDAYLLVQMKRPDDFIAMAQRGFFVYDWRDVHRTTDESTSLYELISRPQTPINLGSLPKQLREIAAKASLGNLDFNQAQSLNVSSKTKCLIGSLNT